MLGWGSEESPVEDGGFSGPFINEGLDEAVEESLEASPVGLMTPDLGGASDFFSCESVLEGSLNSEDEDDLSVPR